MAADDAVLRVEACGLCGTDHEQYTGQLFPGRPFIQGHETVGVIETIGDTAAQRWGVAAGDRVAVGVFLSCGECARCLKADYRRCKKHGLATMYGFQSFDVAPSLWGGYATHQYLSPDSLLLKIPASLDPVVATLFNPLGAGIRWGATLPGTKAGDVVAVLGPGVRGLSAACAAKEAGAAFVMVTGYGERDHPRLEAARSFGADLVVDVAEQDPVAALRGAANGRLADVVVDVTAKAPAAFGQAVNLARSEGTIVVAGIRGEPSTPGFHPDTVVYKELRILGALGVDMVDYQAAIDLLVTDKYPFASLDRDVVGLDGADDLLKAMAGEGGVPPMHGVIRPDESK
ncbi:MAG: zinc-binding dehydrogenase [Acidimicrobiales bacterium]|nr:zinc-binding dehydrogenase [Acidimicrobiales bacterium]